MDYNIYRYYIQINNNNTKGERRYTGATFYILLELKLSVILKQTVINEDAL